MIICCGEALIDMVPDEAGVGFLPLPGGSAFNTAVAIGRLEAPVAFLGRISTDFFGEILVNRLQENHISDSLIIRTDRNTTLAFVRIEKDTEPQYIFYTNGTADCSLTTENIPPKLPADTKCIVFGSISMNIEPIASTIEKLILRYQDDESPVLSFDPNIRPFTIKDRAAYIKRFELWAGASDIVKISTADIDFAYPGLESGQALETILALGTRLAIGTLGHDGALAFLRRDDGSITRVSAPGIHTDIADTVGAGDTFHGAFLAWLLKKGKLSHRALSDLSESELYDALCFANKAAAIVCSRRGADPPRLDEI